VFLLKYNNEKAAHVVLPDSDVDMITKLRWKGSVLVSLVWGDSVPDTVRKAPVLKAEAMSVAQSVDVIVPKVYEEKEDDKKGGLLSGLAKSFEKGKSRMGSGEKEAKLKNLLGFGKKK